MIVFKIISGDEGVLNTIRKIEVNNFRCLKEYSVSLEEDLTVFVGENDSGKSSLIEVLKLIFENSFPEREDFYNDSSEMSVSIQMDEFTLIKEFNLDNISNPKLSIKFEEEYIEKTQTEIESISSAENTDDEKRNFLKPLAKEFGVSFRSNSRVETIVNNIQEKINELRKNDFIIKVSSFSEFNVYFLDGKDFEDINDFCKKTFFRDKRRKIWSEELEGGETLEDLVTSQITSYSTEIEEQIEDQGIREKLADYLPGLTSVKIIPTFEPSDINIAINVLFLEGDRKVSVNKRGDGTKRRITMALLEYRNKSDLDVSSLYVFDEPDTHLHVRAQVEFLEIMRTFNKTNKQVILTTHSPFIMNSVKSSQVRFLYLDNMETKSKPILDDKDVELALDDLGIANTHLFFSKKILIVEGYTEEVFIPSVYKRINNRPIRSNLIKVIRGEGITDVPRLAKVLEDFIDKNNIFLLIDNDGDRKLHQLIELLDVPQETNVFEIGHKEFEDTFEPDLIYSSWLQFVESQNDPKINIDSFKASWTIEKISSLKEECLKDSDKKFSEELIKLSRDECLIPMKKPELGSVLAKNIQINELDNKIIDLFEKLNQE